MITEFKIFVVSLLALATAAAGTMCQSSAKKPTNRPKIHYRSKAKPTPKPSISKDTWGHQSYLINPDGSWRWIPPGPVIVEDVIQPSPTPTPSRNKPESF